jgi:signal transduction histidine kinase
MGLRWLLALFFFILVAIGGGLLWLFNVTTLAQIPDPVTGFFVLSSAAIFLAIFIAFVGIAFFLLAGSIGRPLRRLSKALDAFAESGERLPLAEANMSPKEVTTLEHSFTALADKVDEAHKRDTEVSRVKSDFISTAAHQLRTPLTGIRWALEALEKSNLTDEQKQLAANAVTKSKELVAIVGTLLDISSIESGKYKYTFAPTDLVQILDAVGKDFSVMANKQNVSLLYVKSGSPIPLVRADGERIKWVLNNLVENAIRYTPAGGTVRLSTDTTPGLVRVHVRDTGIGILPKDRQNIFERFFRGGNAVAKENEGNGLGLYIARTIATDHGGDLEFSENTDGPGTTFTLALPIAAQGS